jgi:branched-chain amino acid aminotransferase
MPSTNYAYVNGRFVPENEATVSIFDRGFLYGDGVFETMRVYSGMAFRLLEHIARLVTGIDMLGIDLEETPQHLQGVCEEVVTRNKVVDGMMRIYITRGLSNVGLSGRSAARPTIVAVAQEKAFSARGMPLRVVVAGVRVDALSRLARVKSANRLPYVLAKLEAERRGADDAILLNATDHAVELTASNLFIYQEGKLITPPLTDGALPGITRSLVLMLAAQAGIDAGEASFSSGMVYRAEEAFATNSLFEISPIIGVDDRPLSGRRITGRLQEAYREHVREELQLP